MSAYLWMPKFMAGCHYNEEEINRDLKQKNRILAGSKVIATKLQLRSNPENASRHCKGADFSWMSSKVSRTLLGSSKMVKIWTYCKIKSISPTKTKRSSGQNFGILLMYFGCHWNSLKCLYLPSIFIFGYTKQHFGVMYKNLMQTFVSRIFSRCFGYDIFLMI